ATALSTLALAVEYWLLPLAQLPENQGEVVPLLILFVIVSLLSNYLGKQCWQAVHASERVRATVANLEDALKLADGDRGQTFLKPAAPSLPAWKQEAAGDKLLVYAGHGTEETAFHAVEPVGIGLLSRGKAVRNGDGSLCGTLLRLGEGTVARQVESERRQRDDPFRALAASAPVGLLQMDADRQCVYTNAACQLAGGFSAEEGLGDGWTRFLHPEDRDRVVPAWAAAMDAGEEFVCDFRFQTPQPQGRWV